MVESAAYKAKAEAKPERLEHNKNDSIPTEIIKIEVEEDMKAEAFKVLKELGMTPSEAINSLFTELVRWRKMPFKPKEKIPNAETIAAMEESRNHLERLKEFNSINELKKEFGH